MSLTHRLLQNALADMQRSLNVFDQPFFGRRLSSPLMDDISLEAITPSFFGSKSLANKAYPATDIKETADGYELYAEIPGYDKKDIVIELLDSRTLVLSGSIKKEENKKTHTFEEDNKADLNVAKQQRHIKNAQEVLKEDAEHEDIAVDEAKSPDWWVNERVYGSFRRTFTFPHSIEQDKVKASHENGVLKILAPKKTKGSSRLIDID